MNHRVSRLIFTSLAASALVAAMLPSTASASTTLEQCFTPVINKATDYASTRDYNTGCGDVAVQGTFNPAGTTSSITTGWFWDATYARTGTIKEIQSSKHKWA